MDSFLFSFPSDMRRMIYSYFPKSVFLEISASTYVFARESSLYDSDMVEDMCKIAIKKDNYNFIFEMFHLKRLSRRLNSFVLLPFASEMNNVGMVKYLLSMGGDPSIRCHKLFKDCCRLGYIDQIRVLLKHPLVDPCCGHHFALRVSSSNNFDDIFGMLLLDDRVRSKLSILSTKSWSRLIF